jgi:hypothetical protein
MNISSQSAISIYQLHAASLFATSSAILLAAALADSVWRARSVSEMLGWPGVVLLFASFACLLHSGTLDEDQRTRKRALPGWTPNDIFKSDESDTTDHPMRDRLLDG